LKEKILEISRKMSELLIVYSGSFLWESVRCSRSLSQSAKYYLLMPPNRWIMELITPWCQYVNLSAINADMVNAEFFRFLMESAFVGSDDTVYIKMCWNEVVLSPEHGIVNGAVLLGINSINI
jgi:hypothetical protein